MLMQGLEWIQLMRRWIHQMISAGHRKKASKIDRQEFINRKTPIKKNIRNAMKHEATLVAKKCFYCSIKSSKF
jgi:hypothetical protein